MKLRSKAMTKTQIRQYLRKLQLENLTPEPTLATLQKLQDAHLKFIPYDNFDCLNSKITSLDRKKMFDKMILHNRGGICFELNGLYAWLLESLGFNFTSFAGRFINKMNVYQKRQHRNMCVELDGKRYITDVGVNSESPRTPLLLEENLVQGDGISQYKFTRDEFWGWLLWQKEKGKPWKRMLGFTEEPQQEMDYVFPCFWCDAHPASPFNKEKELSIFREDCNITIRGNYLKFYLDGRVKYRYKIKNAADLKEVLWEYFGINVEYQLKNGGMDFDE